MQVTRNPFLLFIPFLILYVLIILIFSPDQLVGDESRYLTIASNYVNLNFSTEYQVNIWNGPGYPLLISFFLALPILFIKLINAVLLYLSLVYTYKTIFQFTDRKWTVLFTVILACYYPFFTYLNHMLTECFSWFLIALMIYHTSNYYTSGKLINKHFYLSSLFLFLLCMTKVLFGYVSLIILIFSLSKKLIGRSTATTSKSIAFTSVALFLCIPWLLYTYTLTGKYFYWSSAGGKSLYAMTSPYDNDLGDWKSTKELLKDENHKAFISSTIGLSTIERDSAYMDKALENLQNHPVKYVKNWFANIGRLFISYPFSDSVLSLKSFLKAIPNILLVISVLFILFTTKDALKSLNFINPLLTYFGIYLFLSSLLSAYNRFFMITVPFWMVLIAVASYKSTIKQRIYRRDNNQ